MEPPMAAKSTEDAIGHLDVALHAEAADLTET